MKNDNLLCEYRPAVALLGTHIAFKLLVSTALVAAAINILPFVLTAEAQTENRKFSVPAGNLDRALTRFGIESGVQVLYNSALTKGRKSTGVTGRLSSERALSQILSGTGLTYRFTGKTSVTISDSNFSAATNARPDDSLLLETITVQGQGATTEGTGSYTTGSMSTATPLNLSIKETPQSVSVVTRERLNDNAMRTVEEAVNYTTGMTIMSTASERDTYSSRGFDVSNIMVDGLAISHDYDTIGSGTLDMYDRVEIVRGATGLLEGAGNPSASINLVRKRPTDTFQGSVTGSYGRWNNYIGTLDVGGPLNEAKTLRGRFVTTLRDSDTFTSGNSRERQLFYGILEADVTESTTITLGGHYNKENNPGADWNGVPLQADGTPYDVDRSFRGSPYWSYWNKENINIFGEVAHTLDNDWKVTLKGSYLDSTLDMAGTALWSRDANDRFTYFAGKYHYEHEQTSLDARATGPLEIFGREHQLAIGANYRRLVQNDGPGGSGVISNYSFDPANWQDSADIPEPDWNLSWYQQRKITQYGAYATAKISLADPLNLFVGGRINWYDYENIPTGWTSTSYEEKAKLTPYAALSYDIDQNHTVYGSVTGIFNPQEYYSASGGLLDPVEGTNYEVGVKGEYFGGRLNASLALFQINQTNLPDALPLTSCSNSVASCYAAAGEVRSRGVEVELSGNVTDNWRIFAGYAYVSAEYLEDSEGGLAGDRYGTQTPRHLVTLSTVYTFDGQLEGWRLGVSARIQSKTENTLSGYPTVHQAGYGVVNLMAGYSPNENLDFQFNVYNVFDKHYFRSINYPDSANLIGEPRSFLLTAKYKF